jgi:hypothetical protein
MAGRPPGAQNKDKPFANALRMELAAAGDDHKVLRAIARNLIADAQKPENALPAIKEIADRLDGKPAQESSMTVTRVSAKELSDSELDDIIARSRVGEERAPDDPSQLN